MNKSSAIIIVLLLIIIGLVAWMFVAKPAEAPIVPDNSSTGNTAEVPNNTGNETTAPSPSPLHEKIVITSPKANTTVSKNFTVTGKAPGNWFFEASAPVMVRTPSGDKIFQGTAQTLGDWMTTSLVDFKADVKITGSYTGPATLVMIKDNPSGIPENDDSLEIPITIQ